MRILRRLAACAAGRWRREDRKLSVAAVGGVLVVVAHAVLALSVLTGLRVGVPLPPPPDHGGDRPFLRPPIENRALRPREAQRFARAESRPSAAAAHAVLVLAVAARRRRRPVRVKVPQSATCRRHGWVLFASDAAPACELLLASFEDVGGAV